MVGNRLGIPADAVDPAVASTYFLRGRARWWSNHTYPSSGHGGCEAHQSTQSPSADEDHRCPHSATVIAAPGAPASPVWVMTSSESCAKACRIQPVCLCFPEVGCQHGAWQGLAYGFGVGRRQVDGHVGDPGPPGCWLSVQPGDGGDAGATLDLGEQTTGAGGVDEPGVPPVGHQHPPLGVRSWAKTGLPPRVSSIPRTFTGGSGAANGTRTCSTNALCTMDQSTPKWAADSETTRPCSAIAYPSSVRSRVVSLERTRTAGSDSVNEARGHSRSLQRHRRLCQINRNTPVP